MVFGGQADSEIEVNMGNNYDTYSRYYDRYTSEDGYAAVIVDRMQAASVMTFNRGFEHARILDAACGTGNSTNALLKYSDYVSGFDASRGMLRVARDKFQDKIFLFEDRLESFTISGEYDFVTCVYGSVNHILSFDGLVGFMRSVSEVLTDGGILAFDANTKFIYEEYWSYPCVDYNTGSHLLYREPLEHDGSIYSILLYSIEATDVSDRWMTTKNVMTERFYTVDDFCSAADQAGLIVNATFGLAGREDRLTSKVDVESDNRSIFLLSRGVAGR